MLRAIMRFTPQPETLRFHPILKIRILPVSPVSALVNFPTMDSLTQTQDFCITRNGIHNDVEITIVPTRVARPGFDTDYRLIFKNKGNQTLSGDINFTFDDTVLDVVSTAPAASQSLNNLKLGLQRPVAF